MSVTLQNQKVEVHLENSDGSVTLAESSKSTIVVGNTGVQGPAGPAGVGSATKVADSAVGGQRVVVSVSADGIVHADSDDLTHLNKVLGVTKTAAAAGDEVEVISLGEIEEASFSFTPDQPVFVSAGGSGLLTQTPPTSGFSLRIGHALSATKVFIKISEGILL